MPFLVEGTYILPFLKPKKVAGLIIAKRKPDGSKQEMYEGGEENSGLEACAEDLMRALNSKDAKAVAEALKAAFEICDAAPHVEGEHINESESK